MIDELFETIVNTFIGYAAMMIITLQDINVLVGITVGLATTIYLSCKIVKVIKELRK